ncbi:unnamed protein product [Brassica rapa]|uniref:Uncharacterized protein n=1 Tax=Brassica campestris TaxID=3711 RepID=A0A8D9CXF5_BRACM|nr:unnamed protein product [Brassica rapa]
MSSSGITKPRWTIACVGISSFRALGSNSASLLRCLRIRSRETTTVIRDCKAATWKNSDVPLLPYARWFFISSTVKRLLYWLQLLSATACVA